MDESERLEEVFGLAELIVQSEQMETKQILIVDCRRFYDYNLSHIRTATNVPYSKLLLRRLESKKLSILELLFSSCKLTQENEHSNDPKVLCLILYVSKFGIISDKSDISEVSFMKTLYHRLAESASFNDIKLLNGGFLDFQARYPELCEGAGLPGMSENKLGGHGKLSLATLSQPCLSTSCTQGPTKILPFVYLGSQQDVLDQEVLKKYGIDYVLNMSTNCPKPDFIQEEHFLRIPVQDSYSEKLLPYFEQAFQFLDKVKEANGVALIHCLAGISRSPTLAIAYVMRYLHVSQEEAYKYVKEKRPSISPNFNFLGQLLEYEKDLKSKRALERFEEEKMQLLQPLSPVTPKTNIIPDSTPTSEYHTASSSFDETNIFGKRRMAFDEPTDGGVSKFFGTSSVGSSPMSRSSLGLGALGIFLKPVKEDLPSPSTEMSRLSFDPSPTSTLRPPTSIFDRSPRSPRSLLPLTNPYVSRSSPPVADDYHPLPMPMNVVQKVCDSNAKQVTVKSTNSSSSASNPMFAVASNPLFTVTQDLAQASPSSNVERMDDDMTDTSVMSTSSGFFDQQMELEYCSASTSFLEPQGNYPVESAKAETESEHSSSASVSCPTSARGVSATNPLFGRTESPSDFGSKHAKKTFNRPTAVRSLKFMDKKFIRRLHGQTTSTHTGFCGKRAYDDCSSSDPSTPLDDKNVDDVASPKRAVGKKKVSMSKKVADFFTKRMSLPQVVPYSPRIVQGMHHDSSYCTTPNRGNIGPSKSKSESALVGDKCVSVSIVKQSATFMGTVTSEASTTTSVYKDSALIGHRLDAERESLGSSSSLEIAVS